MDGVRGTVPAAGFSLVELMVVVAVIAVLSVSVSLSAGRTGGAATDDAGRFAALHARLRDAAVLSRSPRALALSDSGWRVLERGPAGWQPTGEGHFRGTARFTLAGAALVAPPPEAPPAPDLVFLPDGRTAPFEAAFIRRDAVTRCTSDGWRPLQCAAP